MAAKKSLGTGETAMLAWLAQHGSWRPEDGVVVGSILAHTMRTLDSLARRGLADSYYADGLLERPCSKQDGGCGAEPGARCVSRYGRTTGYAHRVRYDWQAPAGPRARRKERMAARLSRRAWQIDSHAEKWLPVAEARLAAMYWVSDRGRVISVATGRILKPRTNRRGHVKVALYSGAGGTRHDRSVHRLVLEAFVGPCPNGMEGCHGPGGPADNRWPENLRWDTHQANLDDAVRDGVIRRGESNAHSKLTDAQVREMRWLYAAGDVTTVQLAARYGLNKSSVYRIVAREQWAHVSDPDESCLSCGHPRWRECECTCCTDEGVLRRPAPCGTTAAYRRHRRRGEKPDQMCKDAQARESRDRRKAAATARNEGPQ